MTVNFVTLAESFPSPWEEFVYFFQVLQYAKLKIKKILHTSII